MDLRRDGRQLKPVLIALALWFPCLFGWIWLERNSLWFAILLVPFGDQASMYPPTPDAIDALTNHIVSPNGIGPRVAARRD